MTAKAEVRTTMQKSSDQFGIIGGFSAKAELQTFEIFSQVSLGWLTLKLTYVGNC